MSIPTPDQLRAMNDPWINYFLSEQERLDKDLNVAELQHKAESFGKPGSLTYGGRKYKALAYEKETLDLRFILYCLVKGIVSVDEYAPLFQNDPPNTNGV